MRRLADDQGAVAVIVAFSLVMLLGCGALVVDVGRMYAETRQLQNGADAAALAIAQQCAAGSCGDTTTVATTLANGNSNDSASSATVQLPGLNGPSSVTVTTSTMSDGNSFLTHTLGQALGVPTSTFSRSATATWGFPPTSGNTVPIAFSICEWLGFTNGLGVAGLPTAESTVTLHAPNPPGICGGPANQDSPGGFGWLDVASDGACQASVQAGLVDGDTGNSPPGPANQTGCNEAYFASLLGETVLMPVFTQVNGTGSNAVYTVVGFAGFQLTGYRISGSAYTTPEPCPSSDRCFRGQFVNYYDLTATPSTSGPNFGAVVVGLTS